VCKFSSISSLALFSLGSLSYTAFSFTPILSFLRRVCGLLLQTSRDLCHDASDREGGGGVQTSFLKKGRSSVFNAAWSLIDPNYDCVSIVATGSTPLLFLLEAAAATSANCVSPPFFSHFYLMKMTECGVILLMSHRLFLQLNPSCVVLTKSIFSLKHKEFRTY